MELPFREPKGDSEAPDVEALGKLKDKYFTDHLALHGVQGYQPAVSLACTLQGLGVKTGVVSSSKNCTAVLESAGIA